MNIFKGIKNLLASLSRIPVGMDPDGLSVAANYMFLFPLVGALLGAFTGIFAWILALIFPNWLVGFMTLGFILFLTGFHHTDGLLDFGDGIMVLGSPSKKIEVMRDHQIGTGGFSLGFITLSITALCIGALPVNILFYSLVISELSAKLAMVVSARIGKSAQGGMGSHFVEIAHGRYRNLRVSTAILISTGLIYLLNLFFSLNWIFGFVGFGISIITSLLMVWVSNRHFKGLTGDVLGATNEFARMASLVAILGVVGLGL